MLLPDNVHPELSIYYNGGIILNELKRISSQNIMDLFSNVKKINKMSFSVFVLTLDWLYLIQVAKIDEEGTVKTCL